MRYKKILPVSGIIILLLIIISLDLNQIIQIFQQISIPWFLLSFTIIIPVVLLVNIQWQILLKKQKINISFFESLENIFIGYFYGFISPGGIGGYTRSLYLSKKTGEPVEKCLTNIMILNTVDYISLLTIGLIGGFYLISLKPLILPIMVLLIFLTIFMIALLLRKKLWRNIVNKIFKYRFLNKYKEKIDKKFEFFYSDLPSLKHIILPFFISLIGWIISFTFFYMISGLFNINISLISFILIAAIAQIIGSIPISLYGLGIRDASLVGLLTLFNNPVENIISMSLYWFVIIWLSPSIIGAIIVSKKNV